MAAFGSLPLDFLDCVEFVGEADQSEWLDGYL